MRRLDLKALVRHPFFLPGLLLVYVLVMAIQASRSEGGDFMAWYRATVRLAEGERVYFPQLGPDDEMPNKHGLLFLLLFRPLTWLSPAVSQVVWVLGSGLLLLHSMRLLSRMLGDQEGSNGSSFARYAPWVGLVLIAPFLHNLFKYRQTGILLLWCIVLGVWLLSKGNNRGKKRQDLLGGFSLGVAAAIKLLPFVFLPWLLWKARFRAAIGFVLAICLAFLLPAVDQGWSRMQEHVRDYVDMLGQDAAVESQHRFHQSLRPLVLATISPVHDPGPLVRDREEDVRRWDGVRNFLGSSWLFEHREALLLLLVGGVVALCAFCIRPGFGRRARRATSGSLLVGECGLVLAAMVLISPLAWKHYYVWLLPAAVWLVHECWGNRGRGLLFWAGIVFLVLLTLPHKGVLPKGVAVTYQVFHGFAFGLSLLVVLLGLALRHAELGLGSGHGAPCPSLSASPHPRSEGEAESDGQG